MQEIPNGGKVVRYYLQEHYQLLQVPTLYTPFAIFISEKKRKHIEQTSAVSFFLNIHKESFVAHKNQFKLQYKINKLTNAVKKGVVAPIA